MSRVIGYLESSFWTMRESEFGAMMRVAYAHAGELDSVLAREEFEKPSAMLAKFGERLAGTRYAQIRDGVAILDVNGAIAKRMGMFEEMCYGGTSTEILLRDFQSCLDNPNVTSIVFNIDSPGGEAFGINELSQAIYDARGKKPIKAYVSGLGCSGAYWIASACDEIIADKSAFLGSIGVVTAWMDDKKFYEMMGIRREVVTSTNAPYKRLDFDNEEHRAELQRELDSLEKVFHKAVSRNRKVTAEQVINDFNQGGVLAGTDAVKAGMIDRTGSLEEVIKELSGKRKNSKISANAEGDFDMGFKDEFKAFAAKLGFQVSEESEKPEVSDAEQILAEKQAAEERANLANAELEKVKAEQAEKQLEQIKSDASAYVESEIKAGRLYPAEKESFTALYVQAAQTDAAFLAALKTNQEKRVPHGLTEEVVNTEANQVLLAGSEQSSEARQKELAEKTPLGKTALKIVGGTQTAQAK